MSNATNSTSLASAGLPRLAEGSAGRAIQPRAGVVEQFTGIISASGSYADARYLVDRAIPNGGTNGSQVSATVDDLAGLKETVTATNLAEAAAGTHFLAAGTLVQVFGLDPRATGTKTYAFAQTPVQAVVVQVGGAGEGAGQYSGSILSGNATGGAMPMGMGASSGALIVNLEESGESGYRLEPGSYAQGVLSGMTGDSPPLGIVIIDGGQGKTDSPTSVGGSGDTSEDAESDSWSRSTDATPVTVTLLGRVVYDASGSQTLYAFSRQLSFDARGLLLSVSGETRATVATTESCP